MVIAMERGYGPLGRETRRGSYSFGKDLGILGRKKLRWQGGKEHRDGGLECGETLDASSADRKVRGAILRGLEWCWWVYSVCLAWCWIKLRSSMPPYEVT
jgi:hypothetical protein